LGDVPQASHEKCAHGSRSVRRVREACCKNEPIELLQTQQRKSGMPREGIGAKHGWGKNQTHGGSEGNWQLWTGIL